MERRLLNHNYLPRMEYKYGKKYGKIWGGNKGIFELVCMFPLVSPHRSCSLILSELLSVARVSLLLAAHGFLLRSSGDGGLGALVLVE